MTCDTSSSTLSSNGTTLFFPGGDVYERDGSVYLSSVQGEFSVDVSDVDLDVNGLVQTLAEGCPLDALEEFGSNAEAFVETLAENRLVVTLSEHPDAVNFSALEQLCRVHRDGGALYRTAVETTVAVLGSDPEQVSSTLRSFGVEKVTSQVESSDVVVCLAPEFSDGFHEIVGEAQARGVPVLPVFGDTSLFTGPVLSKETGCKDCYERRRTASRDDPAAFRQTRNRVSNGVNALLAPFASLVALDVILAASDRRGPLADRQLEFDPATMTYETHTMFSVPGCEICDS